MSPSARLATMLLLAIHLAGASAPCPAVKLPEHGSDAGAGLAGTPAHPCPAHADDSPSVWFDALCPCGCESGAAPGTGTSRTGPALLLAKLAPVLAPDRALRIPSPPRLARGTPAPPDHVPLPIA